MRVLMLTSSYPCHDRDWRGGFVRDLARVLAREGLDITVMAPRPAATPPRQDNTNPRTVWLPAWFPVPALGFHGWGLEAELWRDPRASMTFLPFLAAYAAEALVHAVFADVIVANWLFPMGLVGCLVSRWSSRPLGVVAHSGPPWPARIPPFSRFVRLVVEQSRSVACVSETVIREVEAVAHGAAASHLEVLPLGIDLRPSPSPLPLDQRPLRLLFVGRLVRLKGVDVLVRAAQRLESCSVPCVEWTVIGDGPDSRFMRRESIRGVRWLGEADPERVQAAMTTHDALVVPSRPGRFGRSEGMPRVVMEAWASGLPILGSDTGGIGDAVRRHGGGLLFPPGDPDALVRAILDFYRDEALRMKLRAEALEAASLHAWDRLGPRWAAWVRGLVRP